MSSVVLDMTYMIAAFVTVATVGFVCVACRLYRLRTWKKMCCRSSRDGCTTETETLQTGDDPPIEVIYTAPDFAVERRLDEAEIPRNVSQVFSDVTTLSKISHGPPTYREVSTQSLNIQPPSYNDVVANLTAPTRFQLTGSQQFLMPPSSASGDHNVVTRSVSNPVRLHRSQEFTYSTPQNLNQLS